LPLLMIAGFMGLVGIDLKASTIIIFTISFGIAVDDTIHFLSKLKLELAKGIEVDLALKNTYVSTGKAIVITSVILFSGFASLMFSTFQSTFYIGVLISLTLLFAMLSDLVVLPILVKKFYKQ
jgi:predicted RND superfamily exporter protein